MLVWSAMKHPLKDRIATLKTMVQTAKRFSEPWDYFHGELVAHPLFHTLGEHARNETLEHTVAEVCQAVLRTHGVEPRWQGSIRASVHGFWHGLFDAGGRPAIFVYFEEENVGLVQIPLLNERDDQLLVRFTCVPLPPGSTFGQPGVC